MTTEDAIRTALKRDETHDPARLTFYVIGGAAIIAGAWITATTTDFSFAGWTAPPSPMELSRRGLQSIAYALMGTSDRPALGVLAALLAWSGVLVAAAAAFVMPMIMLTRHGIRARNGYSDTVIPWDEIRALADVKGGVKVVGEDQEIVIRDRWYGLFGPRLSRRVRAAHAAISSATRR